MSKPFKPWGKRRVDWDRGLEIGLCAAYSLLTLAQVVWGLVTATDLLDCLIYAGGPLVLCLVVVLGRGWPSFRRHVEE